MTRIVNARWGTWFVMLSALFLLVVVSTGCGGTSASAADVEKTYPILGKLIVSADVVRGSKNPIGAVCAFTGAFARGEEMVPRVKVMDPKTEQLLTDKDLKSVTFMLKDGTSVPLKYSGHPGGNPPPPPTDYFWAGGWEVPQDYPTGATNWWVEAVSNDGRQGRYEPPKIAISALNIVERPAGK